jgi:hypothetical protein
MEQKTMDENDRQSQVRKPFRKPHLRIYGHISAITQARNVMGPDDHNPNQGTVPHKTTH